MSPAATMMTAPWGAASSRQALLTVPLLADGSAERLIGLQPVTFGAPLPEGALRTGFSAELMDAAGVAAECQTEVLARWPDGSVKWLLVDAIVPSEFDSSSPSLVLADGSSDATTQQMNLRPDHRAWLVETTAASFRVDRSDVLWATAPPDAKHSQARVFFTLTDAHGQVHTPQIETVEVERRGGVRTTLFLTGSFPDCRQLQFACRLCFFAGTGLVRVRPRLHNPHRARHRGGLWDLGDAGSCLFQDFTLHIRLPEPFRPQVSLEVEPGQPAVATEAHHVELYQDSSGGENWWSRNHLNRNGRVPCKFRGYRLRIGRQDGRGRRAEPRLAVGSDSLRLTVAVPEFWQQFPKALEVDRREVRVRLFPRQWDDVYELQGGERKTHTLWLNLESAQEGENRTLQWFRQPLLLAPTPQWCASSRAVPCLQPAAEDSFSPLSEYLDESLRRMLAGREVIDEYGWRNYGDVWADHEGLHYNGQPPVVSHYNNQFDVASGCLSQFMRTGRGEWFRFAEALVRHAMDIDIYHTREDKAAYNGGLFWFTDHYRDAATATHRTYSVANRVGGRASYGGGPGAEHNFATGLLLYYYLTGDRDAHDAVLELADWVIAMDDGRRTLLGIIDDGPTGLASHGGGNKRGPQRAAANSINVLLDAWSLSGRPDYLAKAEELIERCIHPHNDPEQLDLLRAEQHWSYTMFLAALARYLQFKEQARQLDRPYAYARASLVTYGRWMCRHERPYLDAAEELEFPTEAWAAQEFRKANVLRLAARYVHGTTRAQWLLKADALAERAWSDLLSFQTRYTARAAAVVLTEGPLGEFLRSDNWQEPPDVDPAQYAFGPVCEFTPQRARVKRLLENPAGFSRLVARAASLRRWKRWWMLRYE